MRKLVVGVAGLAAAWLLAAAGDGARAGGVVWAHARLVAVVGAGCQRKNRAARSKT